MATRYSSFIPGVTNGLVLYLDAAKRESYPGSGTTWYDLSGNGNNGTLTNGPTYTGVSKDAAIDFDGSNDFWICNQRTSDLEYQYYDSFSLSAWVYINESSGYGYIVNNRMSLDASNVQYAGWGLLQFSGYMLFSIGGYPSATYSWRSVETTTTEFSTNIYQKWSLITATNTGTAGEQKMYVNGVDVSYNVKDDSNPPYTVDYSNGNSRVNVGRDGVVTHYLSSNISQVSIYNRALTAAEIQQNYNALKGRFGL